SSLPEIRNCALAPPVISARNATQSAARPINPAIFRSPRVAGKCAMGRAKTLLPANCDFAGRTSMMAPPGRRTSDGEEEPAQSQCAAAQDPDLAAGAGAASG